MSICLNRAKNRVLRLTLIVGTACLLALSAEAGLPKPPSSPPPSPGQVGEAVGNAVNQTGNAVTDAAAKAAEEAKKLADAKAKLEELKRQMEVKSREAAQAMQQRMTEYLQNQIRLLRQQSTDRITRQRQQIDAVKAQRAANAAKTVAGTGAKAGSSGAAKSSAQTQSQKVQVGPAVAPVISALSVDGAEQGEWVQLNGTGFTPDMEVHFRLSPTVNAKTPQLEYVDSTIAYACVPTPATPLPSFNGFISVKRADGQVSNNQNFQYRPRTTVIVMDPELMLRNAEIYTTANDAGTQRDTYNPKALHVSHYVWITGATGDDVFCRNLRLKNGWVVDSVDVDYVNMNNPAAGMRTSESHPNTDQVKLVFHWWTDPWYCGVVGSIHYRVVVYIRGPEGVPFQ